MRKRGRSSLGRKTPAHVKENQVTPIIVLVFDRVKDESRD
jgi:hypothetical protein